MLLDTLNNTTVTGNISTQTAVGFTAELNSIAFDILSKGIYKDPVKALIRELCANAHDAHICADNRETPFYIQAPDHLEPIFRIRDYGTGIDPAHIGSVYFSYFSSNKRHTNTLIGGKGLGSKTPLAYTDSYAVINYYNGKAYYYSVFKDQTGCPTYNPTGCFDTKEPNGLEVIIAVRNEDFYAFTTTIRQTARWFHCKSNIEIPELKWLVKTKSGGILSDKLNHPYLSIIMGNIPYTYEARKITQDDRNWLSYTEFQLFANVGDYPVTASRDSVVESDDTTARLAALTDQFLTEVKTLIQQQIKGIEKTKALIELNRILHNYGIINAAGKTITYEDDTGQHSVLIVTDAVDIPIPNELKGKIWLYQNVKTRRFAVKLKKQAIDTTLHYDAHQPPALAHSQHPYRNNHRLLDNTPFETATYVLYSKEPQDVETFYGLFPDTVERTDISHLFAPVPRQRSNTPRTPRTQQPITYSVLSSKGIEKVDTLDGSQPIWLINRAGSTFIIHNTPLSIKPEALGEHLQRLIPGTYVIIQKSTPNKATPRAPYIDDTLTNFLTEKAALYEQYVKDTTSIPHRELYETLIKKLNNKHAFAGLGFEGLDTIPEFHDPTWMESFQYLLSRVLLTHVPSTPYLRYEIQNLASMITTHHPIFGLLSYHGRDLTALTPIDIDIINQYL